MSSKLASDPAKHLESSVAKPPSDVSDEKYVNEKHAYTASIAPLRAPLEKKSHLPWWQRFRRTKFDLTTIATQESVCDDPVLAKYYQPHAELLIHHVLVGNIHRFDPSARWTWGKEKAVVRKVDWRISTSPPTCLSTSSDPFSDHNSKVAWIFIMFFRVLLGLLQGGLIPDVILYLSYFCTKYKLPIRLAIFWVSDHFCDIVSSFMATGLLKMRDVAGKEGWHWLFLVEGLFTLVIGLVTFFLLPALPTQTKTRYRPHGWFTERKEVIVVNRIIRDDPGKGGMHNRQALSPRML
ncbi:hypothetical protein FRC17_003152 [Serendipita sp. 399]|nr:hypothetical protein FRC17_003152 [Serendipita sp. 399]